MGICAEVIQGKNFLTAYRISKDNIYKREKITSIPTEASIYQHAFSLNENYITIFMHPVETNLLSQVMGKDMITSMEQKGDKNTIIHVIKLDGGDTKTFDTGRFFQMIHSGNSFQKEDNPDILVADVTAYGDASKNVYEVFDFDGVENKEQLKGKKYKGQWTRFEMNLKTGQLTEKKLIDLPEGGNYELPTFNEKYDGVKENCFTYLLEFFGKQDITDDYGWDIVKYDACNE